jgi:16S rRNA (adenine1518-N6/adenine1519-N6)-dimethyltransferase
MTRPLRKRYGQHLLHNPSTINNIVNVIRPKDSDTLVEIGPGRGAISIPILKSVGTLQAIEIDRDIAKEVAEQCRNIGNLKIHLGDVVQFDFSKLASPHKPIRIFGNLPYNISTPLLFRLLTFADSIIDMHFMLQKEVVDRIVANAGDFNYSRLSVMIQASYQVESLFDISPDEFTPPPKVNSSFMRLKPSDHYQNQILDNILFAKTVETAFQQRRKTIKNSLGNMATEEQLTKATIHAIQRPQEVTIEQYIKLSNELARSASELDKN